MNISIHAPREGSDSRGPSLTSPLEVFLSTLPARGATISNAVDRAHRNISIHAPREGSDVHVLVTDAGGEGISIHAPREGSDSVFAQPHAAAPLFLSTLPARGATAEVASGAVSTLFLSTLPARGATLTALRRLEMRPFLSTLPARGATRGASASIPAC